MTRPQRQAGAHRRGRRVAPADPIHARAPLPAARTCHGTRASAHGERRQTGDPGCCVRRTLPRRISAQSPFRHAASPAADMPAPRPFAGLHRARYRSPMEAASTDSITRWLQRWREGDSDALDRLLPLVYADLRRIARGVLRASPGHATLQTTALVHDVLLRLLGRAPAEFESSAHLLNASARMMRQVLVDRARKAAADKRGGTWLRDGFEAALELPIPDRTDLAMLDAALDELEIVHERMARVVELRYFVGLEVEEIANTLGINERTARRDWVAAREWLRDRLEPPA